MESEEELSAPFSGLKVVDAANWIAAPLAATMLADLGAHVVKVEAPGSGDPYRNLPSSPLHPKSAHNYCWILAGRNKRSLALNLKSQAGRGVLQRLIEWCDVYITNHPLPMRRAFGLTYEELGPLNRRMVFASLTAYGEQGPEADREGFDGTAYWARSGLADLIGPPGSRPAAAVPGIGDHPTAVALYAGIVTALYPYHLTPGLLPNPPSCFDALQRVMADAAQFRCIGQLEVQKQTASPDVLARDKCPRAIRGDALPG